MSEDIARKQRLLKYMFDSGWICMRTYLRHLGYQEAEVAEAEQALEERCQKHRLQPSDAAAAVAEAERIVRGGKDG